MVAVVPIIVLLACTLVPAANAYPIVAGTVNNLQARCGDCDATSPGSSALDVGAIVDTSVGTYSSIGSSGGTVVGVGSTLHSGTGVGLGTTLATGSSTGVENQDAIWIWADDLNTKVSATILLLDGTSNPSQHCHDIITQVNTSLAALTSIKVHSNTYLTAIVKLIATLYVNLVIALGKYNASVLAACGSDLWLQLDTCLKNLVDALGLRYSGFAGLCTTTVVGLGIDLASFTKVRLGLCAKIFFGTTVNT